MAVSIPHRYGTTSIDLHVLIMVNSPMSQFLIGTVLLAMSIRQYVHIADRQTSQFLIGTVLQETYENAEISIMDFRLNSS